MNENNVEKILVPLADGFEETEAVAIVDVLRRADLAVTTAGLAGTRVRGAHAITLEADAALEALDLSEFTAIVLPGGMPGTTNLLNDERILDLLRRLAAEGRTTAAICAAPLVLDAVGLLEGREFTCHPSVGEPLGVSAAPDGPRVVESGTLVTSRGPGTALEFALSLVERFAGARKAEELASAMLVPR